MNKKIYLSPPHLSGEELAYLSDALASNWIAPVGPHVDAFEQELAERLKTDYVLAVNSGTSAIHLGLLALDVGSSDEVICSTFTFCASANPIIYCGARPVFVDSEKQTWNMDPALLEEALLDRIKKTGKKPRAIVLVHLYGMPADLEQIMSISKKYDVPVLEDAAEALGSTYKGKPIGTFGELGVLSFNGNKIITTSGGGALISSDAGLIKKARYFRQEAKEPLPYYEHKATGYNYRFSNLLAAVGRSQLKILDDRLKKRREIFQYYRSALKAFPFISFQPEQAGNYANRWLTTIIINHPSITSEDLRMALAEDQIESRPLWKPMHQQPVFKDAPFYGNEVSDRFFEKGLCLPSGSNLSEEDLGRVVGVVKKVVG